MKKKKPQSLDIEPTWKSLLMAVIAGALKPIELLPAVTLADLIRQAQKEGRKKVIFEFESKDSEVKVKII